MLAKKITLLVLSVLSLNLAVFFHPAFVIGVLVFLHFLFNETDFFYGENSIYEDLDPSRLFQEEAGPITVRNYTDKCIIFVHGFPSTPYTFKHVVPIAEKAGYDVFVPLLPGFGTNNDDLIKSNFSQWFVYLCGYYLEKRRGYDKVYVVGLSMGGSLVLKLAEKYSDSWLAPDAISVTAAPVFLNNLKEGVLKSPLLYGVRSISWFIKHLPGKSEAWKEMGDGHNEWIGYSGTFPKQVFSLKIALEQIRKDLNKITVPIIAHHCPTDTTVNYKNLAYIEKRIGSKRKSFNTLDYKGYNNTAHCLFLYESIREKLMLQIIDFFEETDKE